MPDHVASLDGRLHVRLLRAIAEDVDDVDLFALALLPSVRARGWKEVDVGTGQPEEDDLADGEVRRRFCRKQGLHDVGAQETCLQNGVMSDR